nr:hypothetical protein DEO72_LG2g3861 [Ipomoea batatas]
MGHFDPLFLSSSPGSGSGKGQRKDLTSKQSQDFSLIRTESSDEAYDSAVSEKQVNSIALNSRSGSRFHSKSSPLSMQNSFADILLPKWNCISRIGLKRHDPRLILDMYPLFQVHHKENENQDLLYPAPKLLCHPLLQNHHPPPPEVKLVLVVAPGAVAPGVESVISPILKENELHTWNERYMKRLIESGERVGLLSRSIQPKSNSNPQSCFARKGEKTWNETLKG